MEESSSGPIPPDSFNVPFVAVGFVGLTMVGTHLLGPNRKTQVKARQLWGGIEAKGNARAPFNIKYFLVV